MVTGAARGIGLALTRAHLDREGRVIANHRGAPGEGLEALKAKHGARLHLVSCDLRDPGIAARFEAELRGPLDVLVNNAGVFGPRGRTLSEDDRAGALEAYDVNALGVVYLTQAVLPFLKLAPRPRVVAVSSLLGTRAKAQRASLPYALSKAALNMAVHILAFDLAAHDIAVAGLRPGHVPTAMNGFTGPDTPEDSAAGLLRVIDGLSVCTPPPFLDFTGAHLSW
jgi:NAD(P)-dependent dehydrogenase (short-subunit alcohol dehydrogenase family)